MSLINISNLTFAYDGSYETIFENVSMQIDTDWKLGLIGRNGRGKTTFLQLLLGNYAYSGAITASVLFDYFPFALTDPKQSTIHVAQTICKDFALWELERELSLLAVNLDVLERPFDTLSNGERTKILLAAMFLKENNFLLIDEPTNHLDAVARAVVGRYLKTKKGYILVSHDRKLLDLSIDHVLSINKTNIELQKGNFSTWWHNKERQDQFELSENEKLKKDIKKLSKAAKRTAAWADKVEKTKFGHRDAGIKPDKGYIGHKSAKMMKRAKSLETRQKDAIEEKARLLKNIEKADSISVKPMAYHTSILVEANNLSVYYDNKTVCENVGFTVEYGDRMALTGLNGSGKSSILKLMIGEDISLKGKLHIGSKLKISYIPQDTSFLQGDLKEFAKENQLDESLFKAILRKLDFSREQFDKDMRYFSAGQKKKALLAKSLCDKAHLYIWDEPLNFVDVVSRMQVEDLILTFKPTMIFVEHDEAFVQKVSTKIVVIG